MSENETLYDLLGKQPPQSDSRQCYPPRERSRDERRRACRVIVDCCFTLRDETASGERGCVSTLGVCMARSRERDLIDDAKLFRICRDEKLVVRCSRQCKRPIGTPAPITMSMVTSETLLARCCAGPRHARVLCSILSVVDDCARVLASHRAGEVTQTAFVESFNGRCCAIHGPLGRCSPRRRRF